MENDEQAQLRQMVLGMPLYKRHTELVDIVNEIVASVPPVARANLLAMLTRLAIVANSYAIGGAVEEVKSHD